MYLIMFDSPYHEIKLTSNCNSIFLKNGKLEGEFKDTEFNEVYSTGLS
jgi:hypothetical protein